MSGNKRKRVLLVGWDAADWSLMQPLLDQGLLPAVQRLVQEGAHGPIQTLTPALSPMLWTSIITGKTADKHGILGFTEPNPETGGIRPIQGTSRKAKTLWNILASQGYTCNAINWWPSHPAEPTNGLFVSDHFARYAGEAQGRLRLPPGCVLPLEHEQPLDALRISPNDITEEHLLPFIPDLFKIDLQEDKHPEALARALAETSNVQAAATYAMARTDWDFTAVYFEAIDSVAHEFMKYHPPQLAGTDAALFERYRGVMEGIYRFLDMCLERLLELAGPDCTVILTSDHGFYSDHRRQVELPSLIAAPMLEHKRYGVFVMHGPEVQPNRLFDLSILDIAPIVLHQFGLPVARDMDGKVPSGLFEVPGPEPVETYETVQGSYSGYPEELRADPQESHEMLQHLVELGYIDPPGPDDAENARLSLVYHRYNLAKVLASKQQWEPALQLIQELVQENPEYKPFQLDRLDMEMARGNREDVKHILQELRQEGTFPADLLRFYELRMLLQSGYLQRALEIMESLEAKGSLPVSFQLEMARLYRNSNRHERARTTFQRVVEQEPENARAWSGLAAGSLENESYEEAAQQALTALEFDFQLPEAHYHLGQALRLLNRPLEATSALKQALVLQPRLVKAAEALESLYTEELPDKQEAGRYETYLRRIRPEIVVVSGLPRSGTSLTLRILEKAGIPVFTDHNRTPDAFNPHGYYEHDAVKGSLIDVSWLREASGKAVKVVAPLVRTLSPKLAYRVLWLDRDAEQVMQSQLAMRFGPDSPQAHQFDWPLKERLEKERAACLQFLEDSKHLAYRVLSFEDYFHRPEHVAELLTSFLGTPVSEELVRQCVEHSLPRYRSSTSGK